MSAHTLVIFPLCIQSIRHFARLSNFLFFVLFWTALIPSWYCANKNKTTPREGDERGLNPSQLILSSQLIESTLLVLFSWQVIQAERGQACMWYCVELCREIWWQPPRSLSGLLYMAGGLLACSATLMSPTSWRRFWIILCDVWVFLWVLGGRKRKATGEGSGGWTDTFSSFLEVCNTTVQTASLFFPNCRDEL